MKLTEVLAQTVVDEVAIEMLAGSSGLTTMVISLDVAGLLMAQVALEVNKQVTISPLAGA